MIQMMLWSNTQFAIVYTKNSIHTVLYLAKEPETTSHKDNEAFHHHMQEKLKEFQAMSPEELKQYL